MRPQRVVWQLTDGKRGHERQAQGLVQALAAEQSFEHHLLPVTGNGLMALGQWCSRSFPAGRDLPAPDLIIAAGRACQLPLLAARHARGGRAVYLMRPWWPSRWFDLCIVPAHDETCVAEHIIISEGPLNPMQPAADKQADLGLIMIGGPSAHYGFDGDQLAEHIETLIRRWPTVNWRVTDSRRTPAEFLQRLAIRLPANASLHPAAQTPPDWLEKTLAVAQHAWVSADSVAMIYETLSAGTRLGIIEMPAKRRNRITRIAPNLIERGWASTLEHSATNTAPVLGEATRCAQLILARWPELKP